jgi:hypothetical protein
VIQVSGADRKEFTACLHAANLEKKVLAGSDAFPNEVHELLHPLHVQMFRGVGRALRIPEFVDVAQHVPPAGQARRFTPTHLADLVEQPRITNRSPANHQPARAGFGEQFQRLMRPLDVAIGQHRAAQFAARERDQIVAHARPIHLGDRPPVDGDEIDGVLLEKAKERFEYVR